MNCGCENKKPHGKQKGGMVASPAAFPQGAPWNVETALPGIDGALSDAGNFYKVNPDAGAVPDPVSSTNSQCGPCSGGRRRKIRSTKKARKSRIMKRKTMRRHKNRKSKNMKKAKKSRKARAHRKGRKMNRRRTLRGGSRDRVLQNPVNAYRDVLFGAGDLVNQWSGKPSQMSPSPTDQAPVPNGQVMLDEMSHVNSIRTAAGQAVAQI